MCLVFFSTKILDKPLNKFRNPVNWKFHRIILAAGINVHSVPIWPTIDQSILELWTRYLRLSMVYISDGCKASVFDHNEHKPKSSSFEGIWGCLLYIWNIQKCNFVFTISEDFFIEIVLFLISDCQWIIFIFYYANENCTLGFVERDMKLNKGIFGSFSQTVQNKINCSNEQ